MLISHIEDEITESLLEIMDDLKLTMNSADHNNAFTNPVWWSGNIVDIIEKNQKFQKHTGYIKLIAEKTFHCPLAYYFLHFIDYTKGGSMEYHSHEHTEDYAYILYLNDCLDGETNFYLEEMVSLRPKKSQIVFFESTIKHSAFMSHNKKVLVGGMKKV